MKQDVPIKDRIIPTIYKSKELGKKICAGLMSDLKNQGRRGQINGLVYSRNQMPSLINDKGWHHVIRNKNIQGDSKGFAYDITTPGGKILVEYLKKKIPTSITDSVSHFMDNHARTRKIEGESGEMVAAGMRIDTTSSARMLYVPSKKNNNETAGRSTVFLRDASIDFNALLAETCVKEVLVNDIKRLKKKDNVLVYPSSERSATVTVHPTYAITHNLTNSIHYDVKDDSRSFAVFYPSETKRSCTWLLFPTYNVAIECADKVVISWDGRSMKHCSCSDIGDVWSFFGSSNIDVSRHLSIDKAFQKKRYNKVSVGDLVYTRKKLRDMKKIRIADPNAKKYPNKWMYRKARVLTTSKTNSTITIVFLAKLRWLERVEYSIDHVCRVEMVDDCG